MSYSLRLVISSFFLVLVSISSSGAQSAPTTSSSLAAADIPNSVDIVVSDMKSPHEGVPHGVPSSYNWSVRPRVGMGNNPGKFRAMIPWGQVYEDAQGNPATNTRIQVRDMKAYYLSRRDQQWHLLTESRMVQGAAYREDFVNDTNHPADIRSESDGGVSVTVGGGYNFHFWAEKRVPIEPSDIAGVFTTVQARLIVADPSRLDDRNQARYLLDVGGDYWLDLTAQWDNFKTNNDIGLGRFKYVKPSWQWFNMTTLSEAELRRNPPPLN